MSTYVRGQAAYHNAEMLVTLTGDYVTTGVSVYITKDDGVQTLSTNDPEYLGRGQWRVFATATEMNAGTVAVLFVADGSVPTLINVKTTEQPEQSIDDSEIDITNLANSPKRTRTEEGTVEERSIDELIKADQYIKGNAAATTVPWGIRMARVKPGSSIGGGKP